MSYSRWLTSRWYTFWLANDNPNKEEQVFCICELGGSINFYYKDLKENKELCLEVFRKKGLPSVTDREIKELSLYMDDFLEDVEQEFGG